jgi:hypothetical protein
MSQHRLFAQLTPEDRTSDVATRKAILYNKSEAISYGMNAILKDQIKSLEHVDPTNEEITKVRSIIEKTYERTLGSVSHFGDRGGKAPSSLKALLEDLESIITV